MPNNNVNNNDNLIKIDMPLSPTSIAFSGEGGTIAKIFWENGTMKFEGKADESAKIFFNEFLKPYVDGYIKSRIDLKKSELEIILKAMVKNIKNENGEMSMEEYKIIQNIKGVIGKL